MRIEIINTGSELMLGLTLNTHQAWLCRQLSETGYLVARQVAVPDTAEAIEGAVRDAASRSDLVITTGGLGPTADDVTREKIAAMLGRPLHRDPDLKARIKKFFKERKRSVPDRSWLQADVPEGAVIFHNEHGLAPGLALTIDPAHFTPESPSSLLIMLPGPPRELRPMFLDQVLPFIKKHVPLERALYTRTLKVAGMGETTVEEELRPILEPLEARGLQVGYCARLGELDLRFASEGPDAPALVKEAETAARAILGTAIFGSGTDELESVVGELLLQRQSSLAVAESCTGGLVAHRLTNVPGISAVFLQGFVTYSNKAKQSALGIRPDTLAEYGAVSEPVARQMARGAREKAEADYALSITGIAGPSGGSEDKPVGTVFIAVAGPAGAKVVRRYNPYDRETFKQITAHQALDLLRLELLKAPLGK